MEQKDIKQALDEFVSIRTRVVMLMNETITRSKKAKKNPSDEYKLTNSQMNILHTLSIYGAQTLGEIAKREGILQQTVTKPVVDLAKKGLVRRFQKEGDLRSVYVELTDLCRDLIERQANTLRDYLYEQIIPLTTVDELERLTSHFKEIQDFFIRIKQSEEPHKIQK